MAPGGTLFGLLLALLLRLLPLPPGWLALSPDWLALLLLQGSLQAPGRVGILTAWLFGLLADALTGRLLGQQALAYAVMVYLNLRLRSRLLGLPLPLQGLWVLLLLLLGQLLVLWTRPAELAESVRAAYWLPALSGALAWPVLRALLRGPGTLAREP